MKYYKNIATSEKIFEEDAYDYMMVQLRNGSDELIREMLDCFFSGNWIEGEEK